MTVTRRYADSRRTSSVGSVIRAAGRPSITSGSIRTISCAMRSNGWRMVVSSGETRVIDAAGTDGATRVKAGGFRVIRLE